MDTSFTFNQQDYTIARYPKTQQRSLRAWQAYQSFILQQNEVQNTDSVHVFNDRFGFWNCTLGYKQVTSIWNYASQKKAVEQNLISNGIEVSNQNFVQVLDPLPKPIELALLCVPKSLDLFELFLQQIHLHSTKDTKVFCGFMTKHFSPKLLKLAENYFTVIEQSLTKQKSRFLILSEPKALAREFKNKRCIDWKSGETPLQQYYGVFSAHKIDQGSQFLMDKLKLNFDEQQILDLASGSGVFSL
ncbi:MAG: methyltransferase, partial [Flavobacteriales bacterium]